MQLIQRGASARPVKYTILLVLVSTLIVTGIIFPSSIAFGQDPNANQYPQANQDQNQPEENVDVRVARIGVIEDHVSFQRGDGDEWYDATLNTPVQTGDRLYTGDGGRTELQLDGTYVRLDRKTAFDVLNLSTQISQFRLITGTATVNLRTQPAQPFEIDTPGGAVTLKQRGEYRIDVFENSRVDVLVIQGLAEVYNDGRSVTLQDNRRITIDGADIASQDVTTLPPKDEWDTWNDQRDNAIAQAETPTPTYVPQTVAGTEDLSRYGTWSNTADYGYAWYPNNVAYDWAPYQDGRWCWRDPYGWTWVSYEPWGWAPYHYGRWAFYHERWCWIPGSYWGYSPALVGFIGFGGGGFIGWVPLAPREPFYPWWRRGRPFYGYNAIYINQRFRNSITIVNREGFYGGWNRRDRIVATAEFVGRGRAMVGPGVLPTRQSLAVGAVRTNFNGNGYFSRSVVVRNNNIPVVRRFSDNYNEIRARGGSPVSPFQTSANGRIETRSMGVRSSTGFRDNNSVTRGGSQTMMRTDQPRNMDRNDRPMRATDRPFVPPSRDSVHTQQPQTRTNQNNDRPRDNRSYRTDTQRTNNQPQYRTNNNGSNTRSYTPSNRSYTPPPSRSNNRSYSPPPSRSSSRSSGGYSGGSRSSGRSSSSSSHSSGGSSRGSSGGGGHHR